MELETRTEFNKITIITSTFALLVVSFLFANENAQAEPRRYISGEGIVECGEYLESRRENNPRQSYVYATWMRGFLSGYNIATSGRPVANIPSPETILAYIDKYCAEKPLDLLGSCAIKLTKELGGTK